MPLLTSVLADLTAPPLKEVLSEFITNKKPSDKHQPCERIQVTYGIRPVDLYCYLVARFGQPNGLQNVLRSESSDNLIHWHFSLLFEDEPFEVMAMSYRIEIWVPHVVAVLTSDLLNEVILALKADFPVHARAMGVVRAGLEKWHEFLNPHARLSISLNHMCERVSGLVAGLPHRLEHPKTAIESAVFHENFKRWLEVHSEINGLCQAIRMLAPVAAESFVNLVTFFLLKPELRSDAAFYEEFVRKHIRVRVMELHQVCNHFLSAVDWSAPDCQSLNSLMNRRNDYLHGNFRPLMESFGTVYFKGTIPLFTDWRDFYDRCFGPYLKNFSAQSAENDLVTVEAFKSYLLSCIDSKVYDEIRLLSESEELGFNEKTGRLGHLFTDILIDGFTTHGPDDFDNLGDGI